MISRKINKIALIEGSMIVKKNSGLYVGIVHDFVLSLTKFLRFYAIADVLRRNHEEWIDIQIVIYDMYKYAIVRWLI